MKFDLQIYAKDGSNFVLLDQFDDEDVKVKSSIQDIADISKVFTDFSQSFTIPASKVNNQVFKYYYNNDLNEFNANVRIDARLEINRTPFRRGKIQLESAEIKAGQVENYKVTFFGDVTTLKDLFGNDKLKDLNYGSLNVPYNGSTIQNSITSTSNLDVRFPLISSERLWSYTGGASTDITQVGTPLEWNELFPAVKDSKIFDLIEFKYGLQFTGNFLSDKRFTNGFTYWKNREKPDFKSEPFDLTFDLTTDPSANTTSPTYEHIDTANQIDIAPFTTADLNPPAAISSWEQSIKIQVSNLSNSDPYFIDVYKDGVLFDTKSPAVGALSTVVFNSSGLLGTTGFTVIPSNTYTFKVRTTGAATFDYTIQYLFEYTYTVNNPFPLSPTVVTVPEQNVQVTNTSVSTTSFFDFNTSAPDMTIEDWFSGTLKEYNLTCYPTENELEYQIEPLEEWYASGKNWDITPYTDTDSIVVSRPKLYNEISFEWQESKSFLNEAFKENTGRQYGSLSEKFPDYDGGKYEIKLPFETLLFSNIDTTNGNLQLGYCLTPAPDYKPYIPKPIKLYLYDEVSPVFFYFNDGSTTTNITSYLPFGQDVRYNGADYTLNFGEEFSTLDNQPKPFSLYNTHYKKYLINLFNQKTRIVKVKTKLPLSILTKLNLNDALIIRDKKYRINDMVTSKMTGEVEFVLINDLTYTQQRLLPNVAPSGGGTFALSIKPVNGGYFDFDIESGTGFTTPSIAIPATDQAEQVITITVPVNRTGSERTDVYRYISYDSSGTEAFRGDVIITQDDSSDFLLKEDGGYLLTEDLYRIKL